MKVLVLWNGKASKASYNLIFEHFVSLAFDKKVLIKKLKHGTLQELQRRFFWLELEGKREAVDVFLGELKKEYYEVYLEVQKDEL